MCALPPLLLLQLGLDDPTLSNQQIKERQATVAEKRRHLQDLRQQHLTLEQSRGAAAAELRKAETVLRDAHHARLQQRQQLLEQQAVQVRWGRGVALPSSGVVGGRITRTSELDIQHLVSPALRLCEQAQIVNTG